MFNSTPDYSGFSLSALINLMSELSLNSFNTSVEMLLASDLMRCCCYLVVLESCGHPKPIVRRLQFGSEATNWGLLGAGLND